MPVLLKSSVTADDIDFQEFKIIRDISIDEIQNTIDSFDEKFNEEHNDEIEFISGHYIHDGDFSFEASEITESEAETIEQLFGNSYGHGLISYLELD